MKRSRLSDRRLKLQWLKSNQRRRGRAAGVAALGGALSLGLSGLPADAQAGLIIINTLNRPAQPLGPDDSLEITGTGSIVTGNSGVVLSTSGASIGGIVIDNGGLIDAGLDGIGVYSAATAGNIANAGTIEAGVIGIGVGAYPSAEATVGDIDNSGTINAGLDGIGVYASTSGSATAGNITNSGKIVAGFDGIQVYASSLAEATVGNIDNSGTITAGVEGIEAFSARIDGNITNLAGGVIDTATGVGGDTIAVSSSSVVTGNIVNAGTLKSGWDGVYLSYSEVRGQIVNQDSIEATQRSDGSGIDISASSSVIGGIVNEGDIAGALASILVTSDSSVGGISNSGTLDGALLVSGTNGSGGGIDVTNSGSIDIGSSESYISGSFTQPGSSLAITLLSFADYTEAPLTIVDDATIAGELLLGFNPSFVFSPFSRFTLIDIGGTLSGQFNNYADDAFVESFSGGYDVFIDYTDEGNIELYANSSVPLPSTAALIGIGLFGWSRIRRGRGV